MRGSIRICLLLSSSALTLFPGQTAEPRRPIEPITLLIAAGPNGAERVGDRDSLGNTASTIRAQFEAMPPTEWWRGLVAIYGVQQSNRFKLSRQPAAGDANYVEPLFFALPRVNEPDTADITGAWRCTATRSDNSDAWFVWQFTAEKGAIAGRFDPSTEYRVASVSGGKFKTNRLEVSVEYANEMYRLKGALQDGKLSGTWNSTDEQGRWEGTRLPSPPHRLPTGAIVPLIEWHRASDGARRYIAGTNSPGSAWTPASEPVCRVWALSKLE